MTVRSRALALLGVLLMASAAVLGAILVHDGEVAVTSDLSQVAPGKDVSLKGTPAPFAPGGPQRAWHGILPSLDNHTYTLDHADAAGSDVVVLLTSDHAAPRGVVLAEGTVGLVAPHPDGSGRLLVVVHVKDWREPILFR